MVRKMAIVTASLMALVFMSGFQQACAQYWDPAGAAAGINPDFTKGYFQALSRGGTPAPADVQSYALSQGNNAYATGLSSGETPAQATQDAINSYYKAYQFASTGVNQNVQQSADAAILANQTATTGTLMASVGGPLSAGIAAGALGNAADNVNNSFFNGVDNAQNNFFSQPVPPPPLTSPTTPSSPLASSPVSSSSSTSGSPTSLLSAVGTGSPSAPVASSSPSAPVASSPSSLLSSPGAGSSPSSPSARIPVAPSISSMSPEGGAAVGLTLPGRMSQPPSAAPMPTMPTIDSSKLRTGTIQPSAPQSTPTTTSPQQSASRAPRTMPRQVAPSAGGAGGAQ